MVRASGEPTVRAPARAHGEASASRQETSVQNSNPSHNPSPSTSLSPETLARAYERAVRRMRKGDHGTGSLFAALTDESPDASARPRSTTAPQVAAEPHERDARVDHGNPPAGGAAITLNELLPVPRADRVGARAGRATRRE
jgi:hypothetical protein